jgi:hypothetical protein
MVCMRCPAACHLRVRAATDCCFATGFLGLTQVRSVERLVRALLEGVPADAHAGGKVQARKPAALLMVNMWRCCVFDSSKQSYRATGFIEKVRALCVACAPHPLS